jgi:hypothetical protein
MMMGMKTERSATVTVRVIAAFMFFATAMALLAGSSLLFPGPLLDAMWELNPDAHAVFETVGPAMGILLLLLGVATCATGLGLLRHKMWAWVVALAIFAINACGDLVTLFWRRDLLRGGSGILIAGAFLFLLTRPRVRNSFH